MMLFDKEKEVKGDKADLTEWFLGAKRVLLSDIGGLIKMLVSRIKKRRDHRQTV